MAQIAFGTFIFSGPLAPYSSQGLGLILFGNFAACLVIALAVGAYHIVLGGLGISGEEARAAGLLFSSTTDGNLWPALLPADVSHVDWGALSAQIPDRKVFC